MRTFPDDFRIKPGFETLRDLMEDWPDIGVSDSGGSTTSAGDEGGTDDASADGPVAL